MATKPRTSGYERCFSYTVHINEGPNFYILFKDIFIKQIYYFESQRPDPLILDCGSNIGMSILYFKHIYPKARIVGFEPDPTIFSYLQENISNNKLSNIKLVQSALARHSGSIRTFYSDGKYSGALTEYAHDDITEGWQKYEVPCVRLRDYLAEPVDFLKMNIEGAEFDVLDDSKDKLRQVREMIIEYHHLPWLPRTLHNILELLSNQGFEYLISNFYAETNNEAQPPFHLTRDSRYYLLIYAKKMG